MCEQEKMNGVIQPASIFYLSNNFVVKGPLDLVSYEGLNKKLSYLYTSLYNLHNSFICIICLIFTVTSWDKNIFYFLLKKKKHVQMIFRDNKQQN